MILRKLKVVILLIIILLADVNVDAQTNALGLRLALGDGTGIEASYQHNFSKVNRVEIDLGLDTDIFLRGAAAYQWIFDLSKLYTGFNWYAGVGGGLVLYDGGANIGIVGNLGIEYNFEFPLQLSLDLQPGYYFFKGGSDFGFGGVALGIRYKF